MGIGWYNTLPINAVADRVSRVDFLARLSDEFAHKGSLRGKFSRAHKRWDVTRMWLLKSKRLSLTAWFRNGNISWVFRRLHHNWWNNYWEIGITFERRNFTHARRSTRAWDVDMTTFTFVPRISCATWTS